MRVRRALHAAGLRFSTAGKASPWTTGSDISEQTGGAVRARLVWHRHPDPECKLTRLPKSRLDFWLPKLDGNRTRDERVKAQLEGLGWMVVEIWECETKAVGGIVPADGAQAHEKESDRDALRLEKKRWTANSLVIGRLSLRLFLNAEGKSEFILISFNYQSRIEREAQCGTPPFPQHQHHG
jgi:DNA mismatch endonuclease (patch repair protein)